MNISLLKKLARSNYYQLLYSQAKEMSSISLFKNHQDLTKVQMLFLNWLQIYQSLYSDLANNEKHLSKEVIEDDLRTEAYLLYRVQKSKSDAFTKKPKNTDRIKAEGVPTILFTKK